MKKKFNIFFVKRGLLLFAVMFFLLPQVYTHHNKLESTVAPVITTSQVIRTAKILKMAANYLGKQTDVKTYDKDKNLKHTTDIVPKDLVELIIDYKMIGLGGDDSWKATPHKQYMLYPLQGNYNYGFTIIPFKGGKELETARGLK